MIAPTDKQRALRVLEALIEGADPIAAQPLEASVAALLTRPDVAQALLIASGALRESPPAAVELRPVGMLAPGMRALPDLVVPAAALAKPPRRSRSGKRPAAMAPAPVPAIEPPRPATSAPPTHPALPLPRRSRAEEWPDLAATPRMTEAERVAAEGRRKALDDFSALLETSAAPAKSASKALPEASRNGQPWELSEEHQLEAEFCAGKSVAEMAALHQRTAIAVEARLVRMGLKEAPPEWRGHWRPASHKPVRRKGLFS